MSQKILMILRHAKAAPDAPSGEDHDRPLAEKGVQQAESLGKYMTQQAISPQQVWCSTAMRTQQTWQHVQMASGIDPAVSYESSLYHISLPQALQKLEAADEDIERLLWIGHNPTLHELCLHFAEGDESENTHRLMQKFPPCSFAEFHFDGNWAEIQNADINFARFIIPKDL